MSVLDITDDELLEAMGRFANHQHDVWCSLCALVQLIERNSTLADAIKSVSHHYGIEEDELARAYFDLITESIGQIRNKRSAN